MFSNIFADIIINSMTDQNEVHWSKKVCTPMIYNRSKKLILQGRALIKQND